MKYGPGSDVALRVPAEPAQYAVQAEADEVRPHRPAARAV